MSEVIFSYLPSARQMLRLTRFALGKVRVPAAAIDSGETTVSLASVSRGFSLQL